MFRVLSSEMFQSLWTRVAEYYLMIIPDRPKLKDENKTRKEKGKQDDITEEAEFTPDIVKYSHFSLLRSTQSKALA